MYGLVGMRAVCAALTNALKSDRQARGALSTPWQTGISPAPPVGTIRQIFPREALDWKVTITLPLVAQAEISIT